MDTELMGFRSWKGVLENACVTSDVGFFAWKLASNTNC